MQKNEIKLFFEELSKKHFNMLQFYQDEKNEVWENIKFFWNKFKPLFKDNVLSTKETDLIKDFGIMFKYLDRNLKFVIILKNPELIFFLNKKEIEIFLKEVDSDEKFYCLTLSKYFKKNKLNIENIELKGDFQAIGKLLSNEYIANQNILNKDFLVKYVMDWVEKIDYHLNDFLFSFDDLVAFVSQHHPKYKNNFLQWVYDAIAKANLMALLSLSTKINKSKWSKNLDKKSLEILQKKISDKNSENFKKEGEEIKIEIPYSKSESIKYFKNLNIYDFFELHSVFKKSFIDHFANSTSDIKYDESQIPISFMQEFDLAFSFAYNQMVWFLEWSKEENKKIILFSCFDENKANYYIEKYIENLDNPQLASYISIEALVYGLKILYSKMNDKLERYGFWDCINLVIIDFNENFQNILKILFAEAKISNNFRHKVMHFDNEIKNKKYLSLAVMNVAFEVFKKIALKGNK